MSSNVTSLPKEIMTPERSEHFAREIQKEFLSSHLKNKKIARCRSILKVYNEKNIFNLFGITAFEFAEKTAITLAEMLIKDEPNLFEDTDVDQAIIDEFKSFVSIKQAKEDFREWSHGRPFFGEDLSDEFPLVLVEKEPFLQRMAKNKTRAR